MLLDLVLACLAGIALVSGRPQGVLPHHSLPRDSDTNTGVMQFNVTGLQATAVVLSHRV
jgi:hypothetical protein